MIKRNFLINLGRYKSRTGGNAFTIVLNVYQGRERPYGKSNNKVCSQSGISQKTKLFIIKESLT